MKTTEQITLINEAFATGETFSTETIRKLIPSFTPFEIVDPLDTEGCDQYNDDEQYYEGSAELEIDGVGIITVTGTFSVSHEEVEAGNYPRIEDSEWTITGVEIEEPAQKSILELEEMMRAFAIEANKPGSEPEWTTQTIEFFPGLSATVIDDFEGRFNLGLCLAGFSASTSVRYEAGEYWSLGNPGANWSLNDELEGLAIDIREAIEEAAAKRVRDEIKGILRI